MMPDLIRQICRIVGDDKGILARAIEQGQIGHLDFEFDPESEDDK
jgi:hypothetical protein